MERKITNKYRRARFRNALFTVAPDRLTRGRITQRHLEKDIVLRQIEIYCSLWPAHLDGLRIGHVSDFHLGKLLPLERAIDVVNRLGAQTPDLIACTGDVVDLHHTRVRRLFEAMSALAVPCGSMLVLGNHDELHDPEKLMQLAIDAGITVLQDQTVEVPHGDGILRVAGIGWAKSAIACARAVDRTYDKETHLLLSHNPKAFLRASSLAIPLTLSGHTHGGQVAMKKRPNTNLALAHRHSAGLFKRGASRLYVTPGVGAWFPLRINCPAEIALITMRHGEDPEPNE
jgi:hypothetical protein